MTSESSAEDNSIIFWKGLGILTGLMLLLCVIAWANDRHRLSHANHGPDESVAAIKSEYSALLTEADVQASEASKINDELANMLLTKEGELHQLAANLKSAEQEIAKLKQPKVDPAAVAALESAQTELVSAQKAQATAEQAANLSRARIARLEEHRNSLQRRLDRMAAEHEALEERIAATASVAEASDSERDQWRLQNADLKAEVASLQQIVNELNESCALRDNALAELQQVAEEHRKQQAQLDSRLAESAALMAANEARMTKMSAQNEVMKKVTREAEARVVELTRQHHEAIAQLKAQQASATVATQPSVAPETHQGTASGDSMAELRILRARDDSRALEIRRLEQEVAALKAALKRSGN